MRSRRRILVTALVLGVMIVTIVAGVVRFYHSLHEVGLRDDFDDVELVRIIAHAERANSAYHEAAVFGKEFGPEVDCGEFPGSGLRVYLDHNPTGKAQWVVLRGTANMKNIFNDLEFVSSEEHELGIRVHSGFDAALQECLPWVLERLDKTRPIRITGHSLGGSVAAQLVATLDHRGFKEVSAITFGQPKFTDAYGAAKLAHLKILRIVHDEDPVPMLPPVAIEGMGLAVYHHFGPEVIVKADGHFVFYKEHAADRFDVTELWKDIENIRPLSHDMVKGYLPALKGALTSKTRHPSPEP